MAPEPPLVPAAAEARVGAAQAARGRAARPAAQVALLPPLPPRGAAAAAPRRRLFQSGRPLPPDD